MSRRTPQFFLIAIAAIAGIVLLAGYFISLPFLDGLRSYLFQLAIVLTGVALLVGIINLLFVHVMKVLRLQTGALYSLVLLISFTITFTVGFLFGPTSAWSRWIFNHVQLPVETSLLAIITVILVVGLIRMLYRRPSANSLIFLFTVVITLVGIISLPWIESSLITEARSWLLSVPVTGGMRGILIGIAIGTIATGLRILTGAERPYEN